MPPFNALLMKLKKRTEVIQETRISLNEVTRKKEIEEAEKKKAANDKMGKDCRKRGDFYTDVMDMDDEYLREGLFVLGDLIRTKIG